MEGMKLLRLWFCFLLQSILFLISQTSYRTYKIISSYELARPIMGTIFLVIIIIIIHFFAQVFSESTEAVATSIRKQVRGCLQNLYQSVATPEVRTFGTLITSTKVFSLNIIICKSL